jgi:hypothetical protein
MSAPTDAELETADRHCRANRDRLKKALVEFGKAKGQVQSQYNHLRATQKATRAETRERRFEEAKKNEEKAVAHFCTALGYLKNPDLPGVDAEELGRREYGSESVSVGHVGLHMIGHLDGEGRERNKEVAARNGRNATSIESIFGEMARKVSVPVILERLTDHGWGNDEIAQLVAGTLDLAKDSESIAKRQSTLRTVQDFLRIVEPKAIIQSDRNIEDMTEEETKEVLRTLQHELGLQ